MADTPSELEAQIQTLQDEVDLLKTEIKQTLIDMRELVMKDSNIFAQPSSSKVNSEIRQIPPTVTEENSSETDEYNEEFGSEDNTDESNEDSEPESITVHSVTEGSSVLNFQIESSQVTKLMPKSGDLVANLTGWLGTVKMRGVSLTQMLPFLEAYQNSGHLDSLSMRLIVKAMADLDILEPSHITQPFSSTDYAQCLMELHEVIKNSPDFENKELPPSV
ncbi:MAG: hypothetical protein MK020_07215 [Dehalococcoidia bacterium]|nr:hypothetical protein [Dehalococcoidia bacterium]